jgi:hypothetical protein
MRALLLAFASFALVACSNTPTCPTTAPADGDSCHEAGFTCEEGGGDHQRCSTISTCANNLAPTWSNATTPMCTLTNDPTCSDTLLDTQIGAPCQTAGLTCDYSDGRCACAACSTATTSGLGWACRSWDEGIADQCPTERPTIGSSCKIASQVCRYDNACTVSFGPDLQCISGKWQPLGGAPQVCATPMCAPAT